MKQELREMLGKAALSAANVEEDMGEWEALPDAVREHFMCVGEAVGKKLASMLLPVVVTTLLTEEEIRACLADMLNESRVHNTLKKE